MADNLRFHAISSAGHRIVLRVIDEDKSEPDGYLYPASMFAPIELPKVAERALMNPRKETA